MRHINFKNCSSFLLAAVFFLGNVSAVFGATTCAADETYSFGACIKNASAPTAQSCPSGTVYSYGSCVSTAQPKSSNAVGGNTQAIVPVGGNAQAPTPVAGNSGCGADSFLSGNCKNGNTGTNGNRLGGSQSLQNPLKFASFDEFFTGLLHIIVIFAIPIIILMIIYSGFMYVMARGSEEQVTKATRALTYAVLGGLIILGAELILQVIQGTVSQLTV